MSKITHISIITLPRILVMNKYVSVGEASFKNKLCILKCNFVMDSGLNIISKPNITQRIIPKYIINPPVYRDSVLCKNNIDFLFAFDTVFMPVNCQHIP